MSRALRAAFAGLVTLVLLATFGLAATAQAGEVERRGEALVIYLPGELDFAQVVDRLQTEIQAQNWEIMDVQDLGAGMREYELQIENKVLSVCQSQLLAQALKADPFISLVVPCRFTVFREGTGDQSRIVVGFADPVAEARAMGIERYEAAQTATDDLRGALERLLEFYGQ